MANRVTLWWEGEEYDAVRQEEPGAAAGAGPVWQLLREGAPLTSFTADPSEGAGAVKQKILEWLEANRSRPALDVGRQ
jgi:hypothetical protein